ncbi:MAG: hypothetical protein K6U09_10760 [Acidobacteriia bacterium]|nr:hypothetical protein [Terriglobia bacterium]
MGNSAAPKCRITGCEQRVRPALAAQMLCLDHFFEYTYTKALATLELCQQGRAVDWDSLEWLFTIADFSIRMLAQNAHALSPAQRDKTLELLLCLSNIREYVRHHSVAGVNTA